MSRPPRPPRTRIDRPPSTLRVTGTPIITTMFGSLAPLLPMIVSAPLLPPFGLMMLLVWRLRHRTIWPVWIGLPLGLWDDIFSGQPLGSSMLLWTIVMLGLDVIDRRMVWRDFWQDWGLAAAVSAATLLGGLSIANWTGGNTAPIIILPQIIISIALFPILARVCAMIDKWRLVR
jgi:rod shape-determining protein MreD